MHINSFLSSIWTEPHFPTSHLLGPEDKNLLSHKEVVMNIFLQGKAEEG